MEAEIPKHRPGSFLTTRWSVVLAGARAAPVERRAALDDLARAYWPPLYAYARRRGADADAAADLTQGFFTLFLERDDVARADPERGRFRAYLLTAFRNYLANERERARARKRGGDQGGLSLDTGEAENRYGRATLDHLTDHETPERAFEQAWVRELIERTFARLRSEQERIGRAPLFDSLRPALAAEDDAPRHARVAAELGMSENSVKVAAHRLRRRFGELLRDEVAGTLADPGRVEEELRSLLGGARESP